MMHIMMKDTLESMKGQQVEVVYNDMVYRGELMGASEDEVYLKTTMDWITLPMTGITKVRKADAF